MPWTAEWRAIQGRVQSIYRAAEALRGADDFYGLSNSMVIEEAHDVLFKGMENFWVRYQADLPSEFGVALKKYRSLFKPIKRGQDGLHGMRGAVAIISAMEGEITHLLIDGDTYYRSIVARGFQHLQRLIVVDADYRAKWVAAHTSREEDCEALGGTHLLWHGVWAFKVNATGERTDLVMGTTVDDTRAGGPSESGAKLVLTEWKRVKAGTTAEVQAAATQALIQAKLYSVGSLSALELKTTRYLVLVSADRIQVPADIVEGAVTYRHINVATSPLSPSRSTVAP